MQASPIMVEEGVVVGTYDEYIDHYSVLRTIEEFYGPLAVRCRRWGGKVIADAFWEPVTYRSAKTVWRLRSRARSCVDVSIRDLAGFLTSPLNPQPLCVDRQAADSLSGRGKDGVA